MTRVRMHTIQYKTPAWSAAALARFTTAAQVLAEPPDYIPVR